MSSGIYRQSSRAFWLLWLARLMAIVSLANLGVVVFDLTYLKLRDFYLRVDLQWRQVKNTDQKQYIKKVDELKNALGKQQKSLDAPEVRALLGELRQLSITIFAEDNPFRMTDEYGALAELKKRMVEHLGAPDVKTAFNQFWSPEYLAEKTWQQELEFFDTNIRFLFNFYEPHLFYDPIKGIDPYRTTQKYLRKVDELRAVIKVKGLDAPEVEKLLADLRERSQELVEQNPFENANKSGTLEEIKYQIRRHIYTRDPEKKPKLSPILAVPLDYIAPEVLWANTSAKDAFDIFWRRENLQSNGWQQELDFFDRKIRFLLQTNYFRHLGTDSRHLDRFWLLDLPWTGIFIGEFIIFYWWVRRREGLKLSEAIAARWYDIFLVVPFFVFREILPQLVLLRVVSVVMRLDQAKFPDLEAIRTKISLGFVGSFAEEMTTTVVVRVIDQVQDLVETGELAKSLLQPAPKEKKAYIDINETNEIQAIGNRLLQIAVCHVLPSIQPELEAYLRYQIEAAMKKSTLYQRIQKLPGLGKFPDQVAAGLVTQVTKMITESPQTAYNASKTAEPDPIAVELSQRLGNKFRAALSSELQREHTIEELESLVYDLLEEIKINYVKRLNEDEIEQILLEVAANKQQARLTGS